MTDKEIYERIDQIQKRLDRFTSSQATKVIVHEKRKAWRSFGSDWPIFHIRAKLVSAATKDTIKYCMVILLVLGNGVAIGGGYNNSNYEDKVVVRAPVDSAWAPKSVVAEANVASVINRLDSQPAVTRPDITPTTILPGILEDVRPARPAVTNKIVSITPDGVARTLYCNPGPCTPGSVKKHENISSGRRVASVINRLDSQPAVTRPDITPTTILPGILEDVRPARPAVTNKIVSITPDGVARTLYCNPGPCTPGSVKKHENISGLQMGVPVTYVFKALNKNMLKKEIDIDAVFKQAESLIESQAIATKDKNWVRAISIPISRVIRARAVYEKRQADGDNSVVSVEDDALCTDYDHDGTCVD